MAVSGMVRKEIIGPCTLYQGDCFEVLPQLSGIDAVITDPPYIFGLGSLPGGKSSGFGDVMNQSLFFTEILRKCKSALRDDSCIWMFLNWRGLPVLMKGVSDFGTKIESLLVWDKECLGPGSLTGLRPSYEVCAFIPFGDFALPNRSLPDIWRCKRPGIKPTGHPAEKPPALIERLVKETPGEVICDPFMGSGTAGVAAMKQGRGFIGIETEPGWFDSACERIRRAYAQGTLDFEKNDAGREEDDH
jgi:DNA modification methylase